MAKDDNLRRALGEIAQEETEQFACSMTPEELESAEILFRQHRKKALSLIARRTRRAGRSGEILRIAAAVALILGGAFMIFRQPPEDITPLAPSFSSSAAPFYSAVPSPAVTPVLTAVPAVFPTNTPDLSQFMTASPTNIPFIENTQTPVPTETPGLLQDVEVPPAWQGAYFPRQMPAGYSLESVQCESGVCTAVYSRGGARIVFTEYESLSALPVADGAAVAYVQWGSGAALRAEKDGRVTFSWDQGGHSFSLTASDGDLAEQVVRSVRKIP